MPFWISRAGACVLFVLGVLSGCATKYTPNEDDTTTDLSHISKAYGIITSADHHPPRHVDEIKSLLKGLHSANLNPPPEEILVSSRDGEPYVIIYGANVGSYASDEILAYEKNGKDGVRYVLLMSRDVRQMTDEEFKRAKFVMGHRPEAS
ncbi:hypothetical protein ETAA8_54810 [Anatilimnocola aggregata]|uniref:Lipoprotein n=1 Tax=Anatilimnocola aggregata TaxID=2528021 RepID=A0A517YJE9_9BACT|nr:hypothetical protein [Anatilimnocola aggregata]QDU30353.1 hypothetical protein ETAA8_54810 [Anatilimnocola aggregata]